MPKIPEIKKIAAHALNNIDAVLSQWLSGGKHQGHEYLPLNPKRADSQPGSFSINTKTGSWSDFATGDKGLDLVALVAYLENCSQGQAAEKLAALLNISLDEKYSTPECTTYKPNRGGVSDGWKCVMPVPNDAPKPPLAHSRHGKPTHRYAYTTTNDQVNYYHDRYEKKGGERKQFAPLTLWRKGDRFEWRFKAPPEPRQLYGLPGLVAFPDAKVWFVEGEKSVLALQKLLPERPILTWSGGCQAVAKSDYSPLKGRDCVVFPDNDLPGKKASNDLAERLKAAGATSVFLVDVDKLALVPGWENEDDTKTPTLLGGKPLAVGDDAADLVDRGWQVEHFDLFLKRDDVLLDADALVKASKQTIETSNPESEVTQRGFELFDDGVYLIEPGKDGMFRRRWVCGHLEVLALARTADSKEWGKLVTFSDPDKRKKQLVIPMRHFNGDGLAATGELLAEGLTIAPKGRQPVLEYLQTTEIEKRTRTTNRTGWHGEADEMTFVLPDVAIGSGGEEWLYSNQLPDANPYKQRGTLKQWQEKVSALCAGNSRLVFAVSTAFASPLLQLVSAESGGFHYRGGSSSGKSTALFAAASVCGSRDYLQRWRGTDNGIEALAQSRSDALLILDEIKQLDGKIAAEAAYMLGNGCGKVRANANGGARNQATWRLLFLSSGELSLAQHVADAGKRVHAGAEIRLCDVPADAGVGMGLFEDTHCFDSPDKFSDALVANAAKYYGTAFIEFIKCILAKREAIALMLRECESAFSKTTLTDKASGQARRVASRFALVAAGGELATEWGITTWQPGEAMQAAISCFKAWLAGYGGEGNQEERQMLTQVRLFLESHSDGRFVDVARSVAVDSHAAKTISRAGFRKHTGEGDETVTEYFILPEVFKSEVCKGWDYRQVARLLIDKGFMRPDGKHLQPKVTLPGEGSRRVFHVLPTIWNDEND